MMNYNKLKSNMLFFGILFIVSFCSATDDINRGIKNIGRLHVENIDGEQMVRNFRRDMGISTCPWGTQTQFNDGPACCDNEFCCRMNGKRCFCNGDKILKQHTRDPPNGCGPESFGEDFRKVSSAVAGEFAAACAAHDNCYTDCSKTKQQCDDAWIDAATTSCWDTWGRGKNVWLTIWNWVGLVGQGYTQCVAKAGIMYEAMKAHPAHMDSMKNSCRCAEKQGNYPCPNVVHKRYLGGKPLYSKSYIRTINDNGQKCEESCLENNNCDVWEYGKWSNKYWCAHWKSTENGRWAGASNRLNAGTSGQTECPK